MFNKQATEENEIEKYLLYRTVAKKLNGKIVSSLTKESMFEAGRLLGVLEDNTFAFESENEVVTVQDFAINEKFGINKRKSFINIYLSTIGAKDDIEEKILNACSNATTSLFKIISTDAKKNYINLYDLINKKNVTLIDIGLSQTAQTGHLIFCRIFKIDTFYMTSGASFSFKREKEEYILRRYRTLRKKFEIEGNDIARYMAFFILNRTDGIDGMYLNLE